MHIAGDTNLIPNQNEKRWTINDIQSSAFIISGTKTWKMLVPEALFDRKLYTERKGTIPKTTYIKDTESFERNPTKSEE